MTANKMWSNGTQGGGVEYFLRDPRGTRTRSGQMYVMVRAEEEAKPRTTPASVELLGEGKIRLRATGPNILASEKRQNTFWGLMHSWGGGWMWEHTTCTEEDTGWMADALRYGTAVMVTDGSYDRSLAPDVSGAGWYFCCRLTRRVVHGSFWERSRTASSYRGELLGLVALHTLVHGLMVHHGVDRARGKMCCDSDSALDQAATRRRRVRAGAKQGDLLRALCTLTKLSDMSLLYEQIRGHQDRTIPWKFLLLEAQLNVRCDEQAKGAVHRSMGGRAPEPRGAQLLPLEKAAVLVDGYKLTSDAAGEVRFCLGEQEAKAFYTAPRRRRGGGLGWTVTRFD